MEAVYEGICTILGHGFGLVVRVIVRIFVRVRVIVRIFVRVRAIVRIFLRVIVRISVRSRVRACRNIVRKPSMKEIIDVLYAYFTHIVIIPIVTK